MPTPIDLLVVGLKATIVLALAGLVAGSLRRAAAATRHLVWTLGVVAALLLPTLRTLTPRWEVPLLPASLHAPAADTPHAIRPAGAAFEQPALAPATASQRVTAIPTAHATSKPAAPEVQKADAVPSSQRSSAAVAAPLDPTTLLLPLWLIGALAVTAPLVVAAVRVRWLGRNAAVLDGPEWSALLSDIAGSLDLARPVRLLQGGPKSMPMAWGVLRPVVLLPKAAEEWPESQRRAVLTHELAHVKRHDCLTQAIAHAACSIYWFHPLVWLAARRLRVEREHACDDLVLRNGASGPDYADQLLQLARGARFKEQSLWTAVAMARPSQLEGRLLAILDPSLDRRSPSRRGAQLTVIAAAFLVVALAGLEPWARPALAAQPVDVAYDIAPSANPSPVGLAAVTRTATAVATSVVTQVKSDAHAQKVERTHENEADEADGDVDAPETDGRRAPPPDRVVAALAGAVHDSDGEVRKEAVFALGELRAPQAATALTGALADDNGEVRAQAAFALGQLRSEGAVEALTLALRDKDAEVRQQAVFALGQIRAPEAVAPLEKALKDTNGEVRQQAAFALGQIRSPESVPVLMEALKDKSAEVRQQAAFALGQLRDERAAEALTAALKDGEAEVRRQAAFALGQISK